MGAGCVGFVTAILDSVFCISVIPLPFESEWDFDRAAVPVIRDLIRRYHAIPIDGPNVRTLDVIVTRQPSQRRHLYLVGPDPDTLWHCGISGVCQTGIGEPERLGQNVIAFYRPWEA